MGCNDYIYKERYDIPFSKILKFPCYKVKRSDYFKSLGHVFQCPKMYELSQDNNIPISLRLGCLRMDFQLDITNDGLIEGSHYLVYIRTTGDWEFHGYNDIWLEINMNFTSNMYYALMQYAEQYSLTWSYPNSMECIAEHQMGLERTKLFTILYRTNNGEMGCLESETEYPDLCGAQPVRTFRPNLNITLYDISIDYTYHIFISNPNGEIRYYLDVSVETLYEILCNTQLDEYVTIYNSEFYPRRELHI